MTRKGKEASQKRWVRRTRESTLRALAKEGVPMSAQALEDNLDISTWYPSMGFVDRRSRAEISAALRYLEKEGLAERIPEDQRIPYDPPGVCYLITLAGVDAAQQTDVNA